MTGFSNLQEAFEAGRISGIRECERRIVELTKSPSVDVRKASDSRLSGTGQPPGVPLVLFKGKLKELTPHIYWKEESNGEKSIDSPILNFYCHFYPSDTWFGTPAPEVGIALTADGRSLWPSVFASVALVTADEGDEYGGTNNFFAEARLEGKTEREARAKAERWVGIQYRQIIRHIVGEAPKKK